MVSRRFAWLVGLAALMVAVHATGGCKREGTTSRAPLASPGQGLSVVTALPLQTAVSRYAEDASVGGARMPGIARKLDTDHPDLVIADASTVDALVSAGKLDGATRRTLVVDRLVIIGHPESPIPLTNPEQLTRIGAGTGEWRARLAVLDPDTWPEGVLTRRALDGLPGGDPSLWAERLQIVASVDDVAHAIAEHKRMLAAVGHSSQLALGKRVRRLAPLGPAVVYQAAVATQSSHRADASRFIDALGGEAAQKVFAEYGFEGGGVEGGTRGGK